MPGAHLCTVQYGSRLLVLHTVWFSTAAPAWTSASALLLALRTDQCLLTWTLVAPSVLEHLLILADKAATCRRARRVAAPRTQSHLEPHYVPVRKHFHSRRSRQASSAHGSSPSASMHQQLPQLWPGHSLVSVPALEACPAAAGFARSQA